MVAMTTSSPRWSVVTVIVYSSGTMMSLCKRKLESELASKHFRFLRPRVNVFILMGFWLNLLNKVRGSHRLKILSRVIL